MHKYKKRKRVACPYCGHKNVVLFESDKYTPEVWCCDNEDGGCDEYFVVDHVVNFEISVSVSKIKLTETK